MYDDILNDYNNKMKILTKERGKRLNNSKEINRQRIKTIGTKWANGILKQYNDSYVTLREQQDQIDASIDMLVDKSKSMANKARKYMEHCNEINQTFKVNREASLSRGSG